MDTTNVLIIKILIINLFGEKLEFRKLKKTVDKSSEPQLLLLLYCQLFHIPFPEGGEAWEKLKTQFYTHYQSQLAIICHIPIETISGGRTSTVNPLPIVKRQTFIRHLALQYKEGVFGSTPLSHVASWFHTHLELNITLKTLINTLEMRK